MPRGGDVVLATVQYVDTFETKLRPAVVLFEEGGNVVVAGVTSNPGRTGVTLTKKDGAYKDSVIRLNYIFTLSEAMIHKPLFVLSEQKWNEVRAEIGKRLR